MGDNGSGPKACAIGVMLRAYEEYSEDVGL